MAACFRAAPYGGALLGGLRAAPAPRATGVVLCICTFTAAALWRGVPGAIGTIPQPRAAENSRVVVSSSTAEAPSIPWPAGPDDALGLGGGGREVLFDHAGPEF